MKEDNSQTRILAQALFEIRILLSGYLGSENAGDLPVRQAAHLAYALHNEALSVMEGGQFEVGSVLEKLQAADRIVQLDFSQRFGLHFVEQPPHKEPAA